LNRIDLPKIIGTDVFDVAEKNGFAYLTTAGGIYKVPMNLTGSKKQLSGYLDYVVVNNKDTLRKENPELPHNKNDIQFFFSSPAFYNPEAVSFKYRLLGDDDHWQTTKPAERMLRFSSLPPGSYTFEARAINRNGLEQERAASFHFVILKSWWSNWRFIVLINVVIVAIVLLLIRNKMNQRLKVELIRRGIASDLHDDIGATMSSINIYTEMALEEIGENEYLGQIRENVSDTISRLDDLVWSINPKNDSMEQLLQRMQHSASVLLGASGVKCHFNYDPKILNLRLNLANKRNLYLLFKEMLNNVVKHSQCRNCYIDLEYQRPKFTLTVRDDGVGFDARAQKSGRNGLENMRYRAARMKGSVYIHSSPKKGSTVTAELKAG
jgi:signal transduction histidine kinase